MVPAASRPILMQKVMTASSPPPFAGLTTDCVLDALDSVGIHGDGRLPALNSYENRVYQAWREEESPVVVKFYRSARWSDEQILEEHALVAELAAEEVPAVAPLSIADRTLHAFNGFRFAVFARHGGRAPELEQRSTLEQLGRYIARIHTIGAARRFVHRPALTVETFGEEPRAYLLANQFIPVDLRASWQSVVDLALPSIRRAYASVDVPTLRLHGDCPGANVLLSDEGPHFVAFSDARPGPAVQHL